MEVSAELPLRRSMGRGARNSMGRGAENPMGRDVVGFSALCPPKSDYAPFQRFCGATSHRNSGSASRPPPPWHCGPHSTPALAHLQFEHSPALHGQGMVEPEAPVIRSPAPMNEAALEDRATAPLAETTTRTPGLCDIELSRHCVYPKTSPVNGRCP